MRESELNLRVPENQPPADRCFFAPELNANPTDIPSDLSLNTARERDNVNNEQNQNPELPPGPAIMKAFGNNIATLRDGVLNGGGSRQGDERVVF